MNASVLLVDDEVGITNSLQRILRKDGYRLTAVNDGNSALKLMEQESFDLVISDQRMPVMNGSTLLSEVHKRYPETSRILFSGYCDFAALSEAVNEAAIQRFLLKPWIDSEFRAEVRSVLEQSVKQHEGRQGFEPNSELQQELSVALKNNQLFNYFQPIMNTRTNDLYAAEMLIRWHHPERGLLAAADFFPLAQHSKVVRDIGVHQLDYLLNYLTEILSRSRVCMNISPAQLDSSIFSQKLESFCAQLGDLAENFILEITESELADSVIEVSRQLKKLKSYGIKIALDDFCTGYSSMDYLRSLPVDIIKIDKAFVDNIATDSRSEFIVSSIIELATKFNADIVAEGVEKMEQVTKLNQLGCYLHQGYLYGKPAEYIRNKGELLSTLLMKE